ncbi:GNAT family N-acetyltransferase [Janthinobacterium agaricidamnosum]|uniref:Acetyltransferase family protein n=1 Tax=Janthinobacterium agaricidamnosum NBRC 102515 = DSM 9628 TaxID=1349767 RepID=W0V4Y6_9BURK|nr:GNAT family protein [Janthinobacterium agaricidamnosum]CDG82665.1 acetyltransferase family protein [Janthinobacterium agaricidamnosum NBRC 102515 = DSM 9628]
MLKGHLCTVRHLLSSDLNTFIALLNDLPSRGEFFPMNFKSPEVIRRDFMQTGLVTDDHEMFVIEDRHHHIVGIISHFKSRTPICREIGYRLFDTALAGRGYVTAATRLLADHLFRAYQYHRLELLMDTDNLASERIALKCGFHYEGLMRQAFFHNGMIRDVKIYSLLRPEWRQLASP